MYENDMPTPCENCGSWFDLHDGRPSLTRDIIICEDCRDQEEKDMEKAEEIQELEQRISELEFDLKEAKEQLTELKKDN